MYYENRGVSVVCEWGDVCEWGVVCAWGIVFEW